jgi:polyhydroxybutyrate depolymerase
LLCIAAALLGTAGCDRPAKAGSTVPVGLSSGSVSSGGRQRSLLVYRPATLPNEAPLVVMLHGGFGSAEQAQRYYGWDAQADAGHFVVLYPDGLDRAWYTGGGCCGTPGRTGVDDVGFIQAAISWVRARVPIDARRIYATGISNGGMMAYRLACDTSTFAAIAPDSATLLGACPNPAPTSVLHIHGTADHNIPYNGGQGEGYAHIDGPSVPSLNAMWRGVDSCAAPDVRVAGVLTTSVAQCPRGRTVELITIAGAGHQWPGSPSRPVIQKVLGLDPPSTALDATATIWRFFAAHPAP